MSEQLNKIPPVIGAIILISVIIGVGFVVLGQLTTTIGTITGTNSTAVQALNQLTNTLNNVVVPFVIIIIVVAMATLVLLILKATGIWQ